MAKMAKCLLVPLLLTFFFSTIFNFLLALSVDSEPMWNIAGRITSGKPSQWQVGTDPCATLWLSVGCESGRVTRLDFIDLGLSGTLHHSIAKLSRLQYIDLTGNSISGPLPSLANLTFLDTLILNDNAFSSIPDDFFSGLIRLQQVSMDNIPLAPWKLPSSLVASLNLANLSASNASIIGTIPHVFASLSHLVNFTLSYNNLTGRIDMISALPQLVCLQLQSNHFIGFIPDISNLKFLQYFEVRDNNLTGIVPLSLTSRGTLRSVSLSNNKLQGSFPVFSAGNISIDLGGKNSFCKPVPGPCNARVTTLLKVAAGFGYPLELASSWTGNDPCTNGGWLGVGCDAKGSNIIVLDFSYHNFSGTISPYIAELTSLKRIVLSNNRLQGIIPESLTTLPVLQLLDVTNNNLSGKVPKFRSSVTLKLSGNHFDNYFDNLSGRVPL